MLWPLTIVVPLLLFFAFGNICIAAEFVWREASSRGVLAPVNKISSDGYVIMTNSLCDGDGNEDLECRALWFGGRNVTQIEREGHNFGRAVSNSGEVVVGWSPYDGGPFSSGAAYYWSSESGFVDLGELRPTHQSTWATDVSEDGSRVVGISSVGPPIAPSNLERGVFLWTEETGMIDILPSRHVYSASISNDGSTIVGAAGIPPLSDGAFIWTEQTGLLELGFLNPERPTSKAVAISDDLSTIVGHSADRTGQLTAYEAVPVRWTMKDGAWSIEPLTTQPRTYYPNGVSGDGSVIVGNGSTLNPFYWTPENGMRDLEDVLRVEFNLAPSLDGWELTQVGGISDDGRRLVGTGINPNGELSVWMAILGYDGDFDEDGDLTVADIDRLAEHVRDGKFSPEFDLDFDGVVSDVDIVKWVAYAKNTYFGDANLDGEFNSGDLVAVFAVGEYEDDVAFNSGWADGDWNGDAEFDSGDFVVAFQDGGFEMGTKPIAKAIPEPELGNLLVGGLLCLACLLRRQH